MLCIFAVFNRSFFADGHGGFLFCSPRFNKQCTWLGLACGIAYLFCENVEFDPVKQVVGYLISLTVGMLPLAWTGQWFEHVFIGIFSYVFIVAVISLFIFLIGLVKLKCDVNEIKQALGIGKED